MKTLRLIGAVIALTICGGANARPFQLVFDIFPETFFEYPNTGGSFPGGTSARYTIVFDDFGAPGPGQPFGINAVGTVPPVPGFIADIADVVDAAMVNRQGYLYAGATPLSDHPVTLSLLVAHNTGQLSFGKASQMKFWVGVSNLPRTSEAGQLDRYIKQNVGTGTRWEFQADVSDVSTVGGYSATPNSQFYGYAILDNIAVVPEPSIWAYLTAGLVGCGFALRRRGGAMRSLRAPT